MSDISKKYKEIMNEIEMTIQDPKQLNFVKMKIADLSLLYMDIIDRMSQLTEGKVQEIEQMQDRLESKLAYVENSVNEIEKDFYEEDETEEVNGYEFEIVCPYCNHEFTTDINMEYKNEIICPDCNNVIELDWNENEQGHEHEHNCGNCNGSCHNHETKSVPQVAEENEIYEEPSIKEDIQEQIPPTIEENKNINQTNITTDSISIKNRQVKPTNLNQVSIDTNIDDDLDDDEDM